MVSFNDELDAFESENTREILDTQIDKAISLAKRLKFMDDSLAISHTYIARVSKFYKINLFFSYMVSVKTCLETMAEEECSVEEELEECLVELEACSDNKLNFMYPFAQ